MSSALEGYPRNKNKDKSFAHVCFAFILADFLKSSVYAIPLYTKCVISFKYNLLNLK